MNAMPDAATGRVIVVPRQLAPHFHDRLVRLYAGRPGIEVVVDRRRGERRQNAAPLNTGSERRRAERRCMQVTWSLAEMPVHLPDRPAAPRLV